MIYALICLSLSLAGIAGLQFFYMIYLEQIGREQKKRIKELERHCKSLTGRLRDAELRLVEQEKLIDSVMEEAEEDEVWADVIEDR